MSSSRKGPSPHRGPEIGVFLPQSAFSREQLVERARRCDDLGIGSLWLYDHLYPPGQPWIASFEGWTAATYLLALTRKVRVGHLVLCANFRHPVLLGHMAASLDVLSEGRFELGLGSGSVAAEHRQAGLPWGSDAERGERLGEVLEVVTAMLDAHRASSRGGRSTTSFNGRHFKITDLPVPPLPLQRHRPPLHVGGIGVRHTLPLVARYADVWNVPTYGLEVWEQRQQVLDELCAAIGRDPRSIRRAHQAVLVLAHNQRALRQAMALAERRYGAPAWGLAAGGYIGTPGAVADRIAAAASKGIDLFVFFTHDRCSLETLDLLANQLR